MSDGSSKPAIPSWQRAAQRQQPTQAEETQAHNDGAGAEESTPATQEVNVADDDGAAPGAEESASPSSQLEMVEAFLSDSNVKNEPLEKKRAFLRSKEIPVETIDEVLKPSASTAFGSSDFQAFKQRQQAQQQPKPQPQQRQAPTGPPIITYPEFLVEAHKPPPLITPERVLNATYFAGGVAALLYGASKYILNPMVDSLTEARHDFASHSQSKVDEFNERLSKIVSKVPESKATHQLHPEIDISEIESVASDPTELFHRDIGTQTSPLPSSPPSPSAETDQPEKKDASTRQSTALSILNSHLSELLTGLEDRQASANKERKESMNKVRHYLDTVMYGSGVSGSVWGMQEDTEGNGKKNDVPDAVEGLKKEIRGVKGVLLSARRFPGVGRVGGVGA